MSTNPTIRLADGVSIPQLGFGTSPMDDAQTHRAVLTALEAGYRHIDTASSYGNESGVGRAVAESGLDRSEVFVTTKLGNEEHAGLRVRESLEASLERLGLDQVDLYLIHWPLPRRNVFVHAWEGLIEARSAGLARSIGVANFLPRHLDLLQDETGITPSLNQFELHPTHQNEEIINHCTDNRIAVEAYAPLGYAADLAHPAITRIADEAGATPAQVILSWHLARGFIAIPKSGTPERIRENLASTGVRLSPPALAEIDGMHTGTDRVWGDPLEVN